MLKPWAAFNESLTAVVVVGSPHPLSFSMSHDA
uniref:Uncharacterized protein n=1 Tax=Anguilla anguilla TaxID=7936 RepID=A0A0E9T772_ANGAN